MHLSSSSVQMRKLSYRLVKWLGQGHTVEWQRQDTCVNMSLLGWNNLWNSGGILIFILLPETSLGCSFLSCPPFGLKEEKGRAFAWSVQVKTAAFYLACHSFRRRREQAGVLGSGQAFTRNTKGFSDLRSREVELFLGMGLPKLPVFSRLQSRCIFQG